MKSLLCKPMFHLDLAHSSSCVCPSWILCVQQMQMSLFKWLASEMSSKKRSKTKQEILSSDHFHFTDTKDDDTDSFRVMLPLHNTSPCFLWKDSYTHTGQRKNKCFLSVIGCCKVFLVLVSSLTSISLNEHILENYIISIMWKSCSCFPVTVLSSVLSLHVLNQFVFIFGAIYLQIITTANLVLTFFFLFSFLYIRECS